jgi:hypothetical protein
MSTRPIRPIRTGRAYRHRSWGSPRAVSITPQPRSGGARFNRASNILQRGNQCERAKEPNFGSFARVALPTQMEPPPRGDRSDSRWRPCPRTAGISLISVRAILHGSSTGRTLCFPSFGGVMRFVGRARPVFALPLFRVARRYLPLRAKSIVYAHL